MEDLEAGELASVNQFDLDDTFWWVWMTSLAGEETPARKSVFGRCALIETHIRGAHWMVIEEQIKGASPGQEEGVYLAEKKSRFSWTRRGRLGRKKTVSKKNQPQSIEEGPDRTMSGTPSSRLAPDQHVKVREAAAKLKDERLGAQDIQKRARLDDSASQKTNSVLTLQPAILSEAGPAMKWTKDYDRDAIRAAYLQNPTLGRGDMPPGASSSAINLLRTNGTSTPKLADRDLPALPTEPRSPVQRKPIKVQTPPATPPHQSDEAISPEPETVAAFSEKPKLDKTEKHPALRKQDSPESQRSASPELTKDAAKKAAKKDTAASSSSGGLKKFFGKKKATDAAPPAAAVPAPKPSPPHKLQKSPPKGPPKSIPIQIPYQQEPTPEPSVKDASPVDSLDHQITHPAAPSYHEPSSHPAITEREQRDADREFSRFDQGPLDDVPAFVPESTPGSSVRGISPMPQQTEFVHPLPAARAPIAPPPALPSAPVSKPAPVPVPEPEPVAAPVPEEQPASPAPDRWAQIRKNAAERAQRMNQQQEESRRSHSQSGRTDKTDGDEGDTSGEETIESRVARIKARVAELTGT
jgi:hypothetical protein